MAVPTQRASRTPLIQTAAFIAVVVGLVFLVSFVTQFNRGGSRQTPVTPQRPTGSPEARINFPEQIAAGGLPIESDVGTRGHYDFWFSNPDPRAVELGVNEKSCNCTEVQAAVLTESLLSTPAVAERSLQTWLAAATATQFASGFLPPLDQVAQVGLVHHQRFEVISSLANWQTLPAGPNGISVPPGSTGILRLAWKSDLRARPEQRLKIELWRQPAGGTRAFGPSVEALINFTQPLRLGKTELDLGEPLGVDEHRMLSFICWSPSKIDFPLEVHEASADPCFECKVVKLSDAECRDAETVHQSRVLSGYRVEVTVYERRAGKELDLGPLHRELVVTSKLLTGDQRVAVDGEVKGFIEVRQGSRGRLSLGTFYRDQDKVGKVTLACEQPDAKLEVVWVEPEALKQLLEVTLRPVSAGGGNSEWELRARIEPGKASGRLPEQGAIIVQTTGTQPRRLRIPVVGHATVRPTTAAR